MKTFLTIVLTLFLGLKIFATAQDPDKIIYSGIEYSLHNNPLEVYFKMHPEKRPISSVISSALSRGYIATFEVNDNQLFLKDIEVQYFDSTSKESNKIKLHSVINVVFPDINEIKMDWLTGLLVIPVGKMVNFVDMGYGSTYKNYILLKFYNGNLKQEIKFKYKEYEKFKERQFQAFKLTEEYKKLKADLQKKGMQDTFIDSFLKIFLTEYTSKILKE